MTGQLRAARARKDGEPYTSLSGYPWQEWLITMADGTVRRTSVPASGGGSDPRAARRNAEGGGKYRLADDTPYRVQPSR